MVSKTFLLCGTSMRDICFFIAVQLRDHLDYGSMSYDLELCGTSMCSICYFMAEYCE